MSFDPTKGIGKHLVDIPDKILEEMCDIWQMDSPMSNPGMQKYIVTLQVTETVQVQD